MAIGFLGGAGQDRRTSGLVRADIALTRLLRRTRAGRLYE